MSAKRWLGVWLCCGLLPLLVGCTMTKEASRGAEKPGTTQTAPKKPSKPQKKLPAERQLGPVLDMRQWRILCSDKNLAMLCRKSDPTDRRCAARRSKQYRWTYGHFCATWLPCYRKACN